MADDLVERLRDIVDLFPGHPSAGALREAAGEIERLRKIIWSAPAEPAPVGGEE